MSIAVGKDVPYLCRPIGLPRSIKPTDSKIQKWRQSEQSSVKKVSWLNLTRIALGGIGVVVGIWGFIIKNVMAGIIGGILFLQGLISFGQHVNEVSISRNKEGEEEIENKDFKTAAVMSYATSDLVKKRAERLIKKLAESLKTLEQEESLFFKKGETVYIPDIHGDFANLMKIL